MILETITRLELRIILNSGQSGVKYRKINGKSQWNVLSVQSKKKRSLGQSVPRFKLEWS